MHWLRKTGLDKMLPDLLKTRVYVGISAGSIVASKNLSYEQLAKIYYEDTPGDIKDENALGFVDFHIRPHLNDPDFPKANSEFLKTLALEIPGTIYALDNDSAVKVDGDKIEVVSEGNWEKFN